MNGRQPAIDCGRGRCCGAGAAPYFFGAISTADPGSAKDLGSIIRSYLTSAAAVLAAVLCVYQVIAQHAATEAAIGPPGSHLTATLVVAAAGAASGDDKRMILARLALANSGTAPVELRLGGSPDRPDDATVYLARVFSVDEQGEIAFGPRKPLRVSTAEGEAQALTLRPGERVELRAVQSVREPGLYLVRFHDPTAPSLSAEALVEVPAAPTVRSPAPVIDATRAAQALPTGAEGHSPDAATANSTFVLDRAAARRTHHHRPPRHPHHQR